jgi:hypothetical protein
MEKPNQFLEVRAHHLDLACGYSGLCVGYERGNWRGEQLADHAMEWLPEFALTASECEKLGHANAVAFIRRAAHNVYRSQKFKNRGEFGELFLHIAVRQVFKSLPAISKIYYKSATNETVKGFDAVHVVGDKDNMELWIGEAKFYSDIGPAIKDVVKEIHAHTQTDYLRGEFALITNKIDGRWPHAAALKTLLDPNTSLDKVFKRACIPVLLTYDSSVVGRFSECNGPYAKAFKAEILKHHKSFTSQNLPSGIRIHLFLLPLEEKKKLIAILDRKLKKWQDL